MKRQSSKPMLAPTLMPAGARGIYDCICEWCNENVPDCTCAPRVAKAGDALRPETAHEA